MRRAPAKKRAAATDRKPASRSTVRRPRSTVQASRAPSPEPRTPSSSDPRYDAQGLVPAVVQDADTGAVLMLGYMDREALGATLETGDVHFHSRSRGVLWRKGETSGNVLRLVSIAADCDGDALLVRARPAGPTCHTGQTSCFHREMPGTGDRGPGTGKTESSTAAIARNVSPQGPSSRTPRRPISAGDCENEERGCGARAPRAQPARSAGPTSALQSATGNDGGDEGAGEGRLEGLSLAPLFAVLRDRAERRPDGSYTVKLLDNEDKALKKLIEEAGEVALAVKNRDRANLVWELADVLYHLAVIMVAQGIAPADVNAELARRAGETR